MPPKLKTSHNFNLGEYFNILKTFRNYEEMNISIRQNCIFTVFS